jgi:cathepsin E
VRIAQVLIESQGTTLVYIATDAYNAYVAATGAVYDGQSTGLLAITEAQYAALEPLTFNIGTAGSYALSPNAQIWPRALNTAIGGNDSAIYLVVADVSAPSDWRSSGADTASG